MKFDIISDYEKFITHIILHDIDLVKKIAEETKGERVAEATMTVNGIEIPFEKVEDYFQDLYARLAKKADEKYADIEKEVQRRLEERIKAEAQTLLDKLWEVREVLESAEDIIKPYWEKN